MLYSAYSICLLFYFLFVRFLFLIVPALAATSFFFFFNTPPPPEISPLPLHAPLPIYPHAGPQGGVPEGEGAPPRPRGVPAVPPGDRDRGHVGRNDDEDRSSLRPNISTVSPPKDRR